MQISFGGDHIPEHACFRDYDMTNGSQLDVFFLPEKFKATIHGQGSLGLSIFIRHDSKTGRNQGIELGDVKGPAEVAGFLVGDVLVAVDQTDVRYSTLQDVQQIFSQVKVAQKQNPEGWKGLELTVERHWVVNEHL